MVTWDNTQWLNECVKQDIHNFMNDYSAQLPIQSDIMWNQYNNFSSMFQIKNWWPKKMNEEKWQDIYNTIVIACWQRPTFQNELCKCVHSLQSNVNNERLLCYFQLKSANFQLLAPTFMLILDMCDVRFCTHWLYRNRIFVKFSHSLRCRAHCTCRWQ